MSAPDIAAALTALLDTPRADGRGKVFAVCAGAASMGTSFVTRALALQAASEEKRCALIDLDFSQNAQYVALSEPAAQSLHGALNGPYDASFGVLPFWQVSPIVVDDPIAAQAGYCALHTVGGSGLVVSQFLWDQMQDGQHVHLASSRDYWNALRDSYAVSFIDVPSLDRSAAHRTVLGEVDGTLLISSGRGDTTTGGAMSTITASGGTCVGAIVNEYAPPQLYGDSA